MDLPTVTALIQASPTVAVAIVTSYFVFRIAQMFSETIKESAKIQAQTAKKMESLTNAINRLKDEIKDLKDMTRKMYEQLLELHREREGLEKKKHKK